MKVSDIDLSKMLTFAPDEGKLLLGSDRMLIFRQDSMAVLRGLLYEQVGANLARSLLAKFGYRCGAGDYDTLSKLYEWDTPEDLAGAGAALHSWEGLVHAETTKVEGSIESGEIVVEGIWRNSYEAELHVQQFGYADEPVCHSLVGYASGYCSALFGAPVLAIETACAGKGDAQCEIEMRKWDEWGSRADPWKQALEATEYSLSRELEDKLQLVERQAQAISELSTPVMEIWDDVLVLPVVGTVDTKRSSDIMNALLERITDARAKCAILDITGVDVVDTSTADYLMKMVRTASLLGARCVLTGMSPAVAQTLTQIGADLSEVRTLRSLKEGLRDCLQYLNAAGPAR